MIIPPPVLPSFPISCLLFHHAMPFALCAMSPQSMTERMTSGEYRLIQLPSFSLFHTEFQFLSSELCYPSSELCHLTSVHTSNWALILNTFVAGRLRISDTPVSSTICFRFSSISSIEGAINVNQTLYLLSRW